MLDTAARVPVEFVGKARDFRRRVAAENTRYLTASRQLVQPIEARLRRHPDRGLRHETLAQLAREWRQNMPQEFSLSLDIAWQRAGVTISETRIAAADYRDDTWQDGHNEPQVCLGRVSAILNRREARVVFRVPAIVSLFALTQWLRWNQPDDDAALIGDLAQLAGFDADAVPADSQVSVKGWRGRCVVCEVRDRVAERVAVIRTWHATE